MTAALNEIGSGMVWHSEHGIPVRNLWTLLVYAAGLARFVDRFDAEIEESADLPDVLARLLAFAVERRLHRNLSRGYQTQTAELGRVRGRIDWLTTESGLLLNRGRIACRFDDLTHDTPRNRLVRAALEAMQAWVRDPEVAQRCRNLAGVMREAGVLAARPSRAEMSRDRIERHDTEDRFMVTVAELALDTVLPSEVAGNARLSGLDRNEHLLRRIFEKAVAGLYRYELHDRDGWSVRPQVGLNWALEAPTPGLAAILPSMSADIVLQQGLHRRIVLDTKFTCILTPHFRGADGLKSGHLYQLYSYLRSQAGRGDPCADTAEGILLHPSLDRHVDEAVTIQGHRLRFVTIDLSLRARELRQALLNIVAAA